jgi:hypothetical protein
MEKKPDYIRIKANYSFWKHPIKWIRERKMRKVLEKMVNFHWQNGGREEVQKKMTEALMFGTNVTKYF